MKKIFLAGIYTGAFFLFLIIPSITQAAYSWSETQPAGNINQGWFYAASSGDGQKLLFSTTTRATSPLYMSLNGGSSWAETQPTSTPTAYTASWNALAISSDGSTFIAAQYNGRVFISTNDGTSWTETQPAGDAVKLWYGLAASADGSVLMAASGKSTAPAGGGRVYISVNGGTSWTETQPSGNVDRTWNDVAVSADGTRMVAINGGWGNVYYSSNGGSSWDDVAPSNDRSWKAITMSPDGQTLVLADSDCVDDSVFISTNAGADWTQSHVSGNAYECWYNGLAASDNGTHVIIGTDGNRIYATENRGGTWYETQPAGAVNKSWYAIASDSDGGQFVVGAFNGRLYIGTVAVDSTAPMVSLFSPANNDVDVAITTNLAITFDEDIATSSGNIVIKKLADDSIIETISTASAQLSINGAELSIDPSADLENGETYYIQIDSGAIEDLALNAYAGISNTTTWRFTTVSLPVVEEEEDSGGGSSSRRHTTTPTAPGGTQEDAVKTILEQLILVLQQLIQQLLAQQ